MSRNRGRFVFVYTHFLDGYFPVDLRFDDTIQCELYLLKRSLASLALPAGQKGLDLYWDTTT